MRPVAVQHRRGKGWMVAHECAACGVRRRNRLALADPMQPDDPVTIAAVGGGGARSAGRAPYRRM